MSGPRREIYVVGFGAISLLARATAGSNHETWFGKDDLGNDVVVKMGDGQDQTEIERNVLRALAREGVRVPHVLAAGWVDATGGALVLEHVPGDHPVTLEQWERLGITLASLLDASVGNLDLPILSGKEHRQRCISLLADTRLSFSRRAIARIEQAIDQITDNAEAVLTHGDPGPGNYVDNGQSGTLLDWESAMVAPIGFDAGRLGFIALLDISQTGNAEGLYRAGIGGYLSSARARLDESAVDNAVVLAGLQFVHGRMFRPKRADRTAADALRVLETFVSSRPVDD